MTQRLTLGDLGEREFISRYVADLVSSPETGDRGDDCAIIDLDFGLALLITTDSGPTSPFLKQLGIGTWEDVGHYYATMSLSDVAAMGGVPLCLVAACGFPADLLADDARAILDGIHQACAEVDARFGGGDTRCESRVRVTTTAIGRARKDRVLRRSGAQVGDLLWVSGPLGTAVANYVDVASLGRRGLAAPALHRPRARVQFGRVLAEDGLASACIDMSDGPIASANLLSESSGVSVRLDMRRLPIVTPKTLQERQGDWRDFLLNCGGDYELMFTSDPRFETRLLALGAVLCGSIEPQGTSSFGALLVPEEWAAHVHPWEHFRSTADLSRSLTEFVT